MLRFAVFSGLLWLGASSCGPNDNPNDCAGLISLNEATGSVLPWDNTDGSSLCTWTGVQCSIGDDSDERVVEVDVHNLQLVGMIPIDLCLLDKVVSIHTCVESFRESALIVLGSLPWLSHMTDSGATVSLGKRAEWHHSIVPRQLHLPF